MKKTAMKLFTIILSLCFLSGILPIGAAAAKMYSLMFVRINIKSDPDTKNRLTEPKTA